MFSFGANVVEWPSLNSLWADKTMTKYEKFVTALRALCVQHEVQLAPSGYDSIDVWDLKAGEDPIYMDCITDNTEMLNETDSSPQNKNPL